MPKRAKSPGASPTRPAGAASVVSKRLGVLGVLGNQTVVQLLTRLSASVFVTHAVVLLLGPSSSAWALAFKAAPTADAFTYQSYASMALFCAAVVATVPTHERAVEVNKLLFGLASAAALLAIFVHPHATTTLLKVGCTILWATHFACGFGLLK